MQVHQLASHLNISSLMAAAEGAGIGQPWVPEHRARLRKLLAGFRPVYVRVLMAQTQMAAVSELEVSHVRCMSEGWYSWCSHAMLQRMWACSLSLS